MKKKILKVNCKTQLDLTITFFSATRKSMDTRRRSDFVSRYESLLSRAQAATKAVDELDLLRLQRAKVDNTSTTNTSSFNTSPNEASTSADNNDNLVGEF